MKHKFVACLLALAQGGCAAAGLEHNGLRSQFTPDRQGAWVRVTRIPDLVAPSAPSTPSEPTALVMMAPAARADEAELRRRLTSLESKFASLLVTGPRKSASIDQTDERIAGFETRLQQLEQSPAKTNPSTASIDTASQRIAALERRLQQVEQAGSGSSSDNETVIKRMAAIETELQKIQKSSELAVQMGLITTVHSDRNEQGISTVRAELDKLAEDIQSLQLRLAQSDKQLEVGLLQIKDLSTKFK